MRQQGWTVIELCVVLAIGAVLAALAFHHLHTLQARLEANRITSELYQLCLSARARAAHVKQPLTLCGSLTGQSCDHRWSAGALLFVDKNRNNQIDSADTRLEYRAFKIDPARLEWKGFGGKTLSVEAFGTPFASNGSFTYCSADKSPIYSRQVIVNRSGRVRMSVDKNGDGIHEAVDGEDISCD